MSLTIKGVKPKSIYVDENGKITELTKLYIEKNGYRKCCWVKPYTLTISKGSHSTVTVGYKTSEDAIIIGKLSNGETIEHGYYLDITVAGHQGYSVTWKLNGVTQSSNQKTIQVTGDVSISVTETATEISLSSPVISGTFNYNSYMGVYNLSCNITNNNPLAVTANIVVYSNGDILERTYTKNILACSTLPYNHGEIWSAGAKVKVTFSCSGCGDSTATTTFGNYTGSGGTGDETTTTTS